MICKTSQWTQFNKTSIYHIHQLLTLFTGVRNAENVSSQTKKPGDMMSNYVEKVLKPLLDQLSWTQVMKYEELKIQSKLSGYVAMIIYFVYIFLDIILALGDNKDIMIYSTIWEYEYDLKSIDHYPKSRYVKKNGCWFMFKDNKLPMDWYCISFGSIYSVKKNSFDVQFVGSVECD